MNISPHGCWEGTEGLAHRHDPALADALAEWIQETTQNRNPTGEEIVRKGIGVVHDMGCGDGSYVKRLREAHILATGSDGNPETGKVSGTDCFLYDLAGRSPFAYGPIAEFILCLEVLEHIPVEYEGLAVLRLSRLTSRWLIISWAHPGQGGAGHVNCRPQDYVRARFAEHGFTVNEPATAALRERATLSWFRSNLLVLERQETTV